MAALALHAGDIQTKQQRWFLGGRADRTGKMAQEIRVFAIKSDDLSSVPRTYTTERTDSQKLSSVTHKHAHKLNDIHFKYKNISFSAGWVVTHTFNPEHLAGRGRRISVSLMPAWSTEYVPGQSRLYRKTLSHNKENLSSSRAAWST